MEQYVKQLPVTGRQLEWMQEQLFRESGPFYHLYTNPLENGLIFQEEEERKTALNFMAITAREAGVVLLAYAIMSNHFHFIVKGELVDALTFFRQLRKRLSNYLSRKGRPGVLDAVHADTTAITSLKQFRDEVAYVIRNPYVVREDVNPLAWPWCSGFLYFNPMLPDMTSTPVEALTFREKRGITRSASADLDLSFRIRNGGIAPESFVDYRLVERLFPNARKFTWWVFKNVEAQVETASRLHESPVLTDDDLFRITKQLCRAEYSCDDVDCLTDRQRRELAIALKNKWGASNGQAARLARVDPRIVDSMFPLTAKSR